MRTKTLLLSAVAVAAGLLTSQAQSNVYSANVVGYYNVSLTNNNSFTFFANQLDLDGSGTNNTVNTVIGTNLPANSKILGWNTNTQTFSTITLLASGWSAGAAGTIVKQALQPGGGVFIQIPGANPTNVTVVGNVLQQTNKTAVFAGSQVVSYPFPISGALTTNFNYQPNASSGANHDKALTWNVGPQTYTTHTWLTSTWGAGDPQLPIGTCLFLQPWQNNVWTNGFVVQ